MDISGFRIGINALIVAVKHLETRWLTPGRHPGHRPARDQDVEGHHQPQIGAAPDIVRVDPGRHVDPTLGPDHPDAKVEVLVVGAEEKLGFGLMTGGEDRTVRFAGLEAEGADKGIAQGEKGVGPQGERQAPGRRLARGEGGGDGVTVKEISGLLKGPERGGAGEGVGADQRHGGRLRPSQPCRNEAHGRGQ